MKQATIRWAKGKKLAENSEPANLESRIAEGHSGVSPGFGSEDLKRNLILPEKRRREIQGEREALWRLKSRPIWLASGDENSKFFHAFARGRRIQNSIWEMKNDRGIMVSDFDGISSTGVNHFKRIFSNPGGTSIAEIVKIAGHFPSFVNDEENENLRSEIMASELLSTLHTFQRDKSPDPDGWPIEFYLGFYELIGADLLKVVEEYEIRAHIHPPINTTFLALIPKKDRPETFDDFRPISFCNCLYKIISKIIANKLKKILSLHISKKQFGFLEGHQIHEAIGVAQEGLHSIKSKHLRGAVLKIDLSKAFDRVNWLYIRLLLMHMGFHIDFVR